MDPQRTTSHLPMAYKDTPTRTVTVDVDTFAYRELGPKGGVPLATHATS